MKGIPAPPPPHHHHPQLPANQITKTWETALSLIPECKSAEWNVAETILSEVILLVYFRYLIIQTKRYEENN